MKKDRKVEIMSRAIYTDGEELTKDDLDELFGCLNAGFTLTIETYENHFYVVVEREITEQ